MNINKISFVYPTLLMPGMVANARSYMPTLVMVGVNPNQAQLLAITVGMMFEVNEKLLTEIDIFFDNKSVIEDSDTPNEKFSSPLFTSPTPGQIVSVSIMEVGGVIFKHSGVYKIRTTIFADEEKREKAEFLDSVDSYFYVSISEGEIIQ